MASPKPSCSPWGRTSAYRRVTCGRHCSRSGPAAPSPLGAAATGTFLAMAVLTPFAWAPAAALGVAAAAALRAQRSQYEQVQIGLEQVLDRLERGEIRPEHALPGSRVNAFVRLADEIRSLMSPGTPPRG